MSDKRHLATISILLKDRQSQAADLQQILTDSGHMIMARMGVNVQPKCVENCTGMIILAVDGSMREIKALVKKIDQIYGIVAEYSVLTK